MLGFLSFGGIYLRKCTVKSYKIKLTRSALKTLHKFPNKSNRRISAKIDDLAMNPRPPGCRKLTDLDNTWRVRVGDYRVIYSIDDDTRVVFVHDIAPRSSAY
ncbi:type II toxin-antitoxin system RelE/ParE family toxin [Calditrichota bacterium]